MIIYIDFALEKKIGKNVILKEHTETLRSILENKILLLGPI